jgi:hypothetical protein
VSTMWIKIRTTLCFERFWPKDLKAAAEDAAGVQAPLEIAKRPPNHVDWEHPKQRNMLRHERRSDSYDLLVALHDPHEAFVFTVH